MGGGRITEIVFQALLNKQIDMHSVQVFDTNPEMLKELKQQFPEIHANDSCESAVKLTV